MRKKIEELRNKEEGFTLVELLAVIVILGIIVAIAIPTIGNVTQNARTTASQAEQELAIDAAQLYVIDNDITGETEVSVETLADEGYLENDESDNISGGSVSIIPVEGSTVGGAVNFNYEWNDSASSNAQ